MRERERERETTYCIHWLFLVRALMGDQTHTLAALGQCSNRVTWTGPKYGISTGAIQYMALSKHLLI